MVRVAPEATVTDEELVRRVLPTVFRPPADTVVAPLNALLPERVSVPEPSFVMPPLGRVMLDGSMSPEIVTSTLVVSVRTALPRSVVPEKVRFPVKVDASPKTTSPPNSTVFASERAAEEDAVNAPPLRVSGLVPSEVSVATRSVPAFSVVPPEYVLAPVTVSAPVPALTRKPVPETSPPSEVSALPVPVVTVPP